MRSLVCWEFTSATRANYFSRESVGMIHRLRLMMLALAGVLLCDHLLLADVLVLTSGKRWEGTVTETKTGYLVERAGTKMSFPKSKVAEVISGAQKLKEFNQKLPMADLMNDRHVDFLVKLTTDAGLTTERDELLKNTFEARLKDAWDSTEKLDALTLWCDKHEYKEGGESIAQRLFQLEYAEKYKAVEKDANGLLKLAEWCEEKGLSTEAAANKQKALELAPNDPEIRKKLGYGWDEKGQRWVELPALWTGKTLSARVDTSYQESSGISTLTKSPSQGNSAVVIVSVEFQTATAEAGKLSDRPWAQGELGELATNILLGKSVRATDKDVNGLINNFLKDSARLAKPSRLLNCNDVKLILPSGKAISAEFTSAPAGPGVTFLDTQVTITSVSDKDSTVLRYVRGVSGTMVLLQPKMPLQLTFVFSIPGSIKEAKLQFPDSQPISFTCDSK